MSKTGITATLTTFASFVLLISEGIGYTNSLNSSQLEVLKGMQVALVEEIAVGYIDEHKEPQDYEVIQSATQQTQHGRLVWYELLSKNWRGSVSTTDTLSVKLSSVVFPLTWTQWLVLSTSHWYQLCSYFFYW